MSIDTSKIIKGVVGGGRYTVTAPIVKEDYGLYLKIEGLELPSTYEVDFSNSENSGTAVTMIGNADGVLIPHQFIDTGKDVFAFLYHVGVDYGRTIYKFRIPNKLRPDRTDDEPTPEEQSTIDQCISALNTAVAQTAQDVESADASATSASADADRAEQAKDDAVLLAQRSANSAQASGDSAEEAEEARDEARNASTRAAGSAFLAQNYAEQAQAKADSITGLTAQAQTLPSGSSATASYSDGVLTLGIPRGADGTDGTDGTDGVDGQDGISPTVTITPITGGHRITITDADGEHSADVMDGTGNVDDVQINGASIVADGVANVPVASNTKLGVTKVKPEYGLNVIESSGELFVNRASNGEIKSSYGNYKPIVPTNQPSSVFYGLAKAASDTTQSQSSNAVGNYTDNAKGKIQTMLGIADLIGNNEGATASKAYSVGDVLLHDGKLYKVTASIAQGSAIVPNTNCTQTTIIDLLRGV